MGEVYVCGVNTLDTTYDHSIAYTVIWGMHLNGLKIDHKFSWGDTRVYGTKVGEYKVGNIVLKSG